MPPADDDPAAPVEIAAAVIEDHGRLLIARRWDDAVLGGYWEFPGGKRRPGESLIACLLREVDEEIGVAIKVGDVIERVAHRYPHGLVEISFFLGTLISGTPQARGCAEVRWVSASELPRFRFPPANRTLIRRLARQWPNIGRSSQPAR
jgi:mutator protein MutT